MRKYVPPELDPYTLDDPQPRKPPRAPSKHCDTIKYFGFTALIIAVGYVWMRLGGELYWMLK